MKKFGKEKLLIFTFLLLFCALPARAQEVLTGLTGNAVLQKEYRQNLYRSSIGAYYNGDCNSANILAAQQSFKAYSISQPECSGENGSVSLLFNDTELSLMEAKLFNFTDGAIFFEDTFDPNSGTVLLNENLPAGIYVLQLFYEGELFYSENIFLSNTNDVNLSIAEDFELSAQRCNLGEIKLNTEKVFDNTYIATVINAATNTNVGNITIPFGNNSLDLASGLYFLSVKPVVGNGCRFFLPFEIEAEPVIQVGFSDDFSEGFSYPSSKSYYPNAQHWADNRQAYVNATMPVNPVNIGVATLDGLNEYGLPYLVSDTLNTGSADTLMSRPVCDMTDYTNSNNLFLSFFYEPQGLGDIPNAPDSLLVEMRDNVGEWHKVWWHDGNQLQTLVDTFTLVNLPVSDDILDDGVTFFYDDFQFRFRSKATITGFNDHWHLDYIRIGEDSITQGSLNDVAFVYNAPGFLQRYAAMPWNQFVNYQATEYNPIMQFTLRNNSQQAQGGIQLSARTSDLCNQTVFKDSIYRTAPLLQPFETYVVNEKEGTFPVTYLKRGIVFEDTYPYDKDIIIATDYYFDDNIGTTQLHNLVQHQIFSNYFAYDDGTAEKAYGLQGESAELAYKFYLNEPAVLKGVMIYFTDIVGDLDENRFEFRVWDMINETNNDTLPNESLLFADEDVSFRLFEDERNAFVSYKFNEPVPVDSVFYVGFRQLDEEPLNIGFDVNSLGLDTLYFEVIDSITTANDTIRHIDTLVTPLNLGRKNLFYNVDGSWRESAYFGSLMMRPIIDYDYNIEYTGTPVLDAAGETNFSVFPNPTNGKIFVVQKQNLHQAYQARVYNVNGQIVQQNDSSPQQLDISELAAGIYFLEIYTDEQQAHFKIIKQ
ncbi:MAG: T9SS type A sorting domain-containing protein [Chitinophagales bacterium]|nr:T9SS type A sorting domain-containing protein [Bacteroidota bacterium]